MKILLSAYACEPGKGSEPGVGWEWARHLSAQHELWVVTRANNKSAIEAAKDELPGPVHFLYVDLPPSLRFWKRGNRGVNLYYFLWQIAAWRKSQRLVRQHQIQIAHHVTLMSLTRFSFISQLGIPSIIGPVGGLQTCPPGGKSIIRHPLRESLRNLSVALTKWNPLFLFGASRATRIVLATGSGQENLPQSVRQKIVAGTQIGAPLPPRNLASQASPVWLTGKFIVLWAARLEDHKGLEILIRAVAVLKSRKSPVLSDLQMIITGSGPEKDFYLELMQELGVQNYFHFAGWITREDYESLWHRVDAFAFTSLRETTGVALQEAMLRGKPSIVIANGGPGEMVTPETGVLVPCDSLENAIQGFANAVEKLGLDPTWKIQLGTAARERAEEHYTWENVAARMSALYTTLAHGR